jgi:septal ring factor EnvC (AmiA/AmiB activator)
MIFPELKNYLAIFIILLSINISYAENNTILKTRQQLNKLKIQIHSLEGKLSLIKNKKAFLQNELINTNSQIAKNSAQIKQLNISVVNKEAEISQLQSEIINLNTKLSSLKEALAKYVYVSYQLNKNSRIKWLFNKNNMHDVERNLAYYKYLMKANIKLIKEIKGLEKTINLKQENLNMELTTLTNLKLQSEQSLKKLNQTKEYHAVLIGSLNKDINTKQITLSDYLTHQNNLSKLIKNLTTKSVLQTKSPLTQFKHKLSKPINISNNFIKKVNQGLMFYTEEGSNVYAISPGKVVFSNRLNGYGLLLIIDHGWGFMSLYANNSSLLKKVGDTINSQEIIAKVGHSGFLPENGLYFEIRHQGKATPPLEWLQ